MGIAWTTILNPRITTFAIMVSTKKRDRSNENFVKRWNTFVVNGLKMHRNFNAEVYILVRRRGKYHLFRSMPTSRMMPEEEIVSHNPQMLEHLLTDEVGKLPIACYHDSRRCRETGVEATERPKAGT